MVFSDIFHEGLASASPLVGGGVAEDCIYGFGRRYIVIQTDENIHTHTHKKSELGLKRSEKITCVTVHRNTCIAATDFPRLIRYSINSSKLTRESDRELEVQIDGIHMLEDYIVIWEKSRVGVLKATSMKWQRDWCQWIPFPKSGRINKARAIKRVGKIYIVVAFSLGIAYLDCSAWHWSWCETDTIHYLKDPGLIYDISSEGQVVVERRVLYGSRRMVIDALTWEIREQSFTHFKDQPVRSSRIFHLPEQDQFIEFSVSRSSEYYSELWAYGKQLESGQTALFSSTGIKSKEFDLDIEVGPLGLIVLCNPTQGNQSRHPTIYWIRWTDGFLAKTIRCYTGDSDWTLKPRGKECDCPHCKKCIDGGFERVVHNGCSLSAEYHQMCFDTLILTRGASCTCGKRIHGGRRQKLDKMPSVNETRASKLPLQTLVGRDLSTAWIPPRAYYSVNLSDFRTLNDKDHDLLRRLELNKAKLRSSRAASIAWSGDPSSSTI